VPQCPIGSDATDSSERVQHDVHCTRKYNKLSVDFARTTLITVEQLTYKRCYRLCLRCDELSRDLSPSNEHSTNNRHRGLGLLSRLEFVNFVGSYLMFN